MRNEDRKPTPPHADPVILPSARTARWVASRKAQIVRALDRGVLDEQEACDRYGLTLEELNGWRSALSVHGEEGLLVTRRKP
ncbi:DUF1153 domain-containing protein [Rhodospirillaceae bacterium KN72]|uniref:DUF1153 domain-containing protein n=1 Tax=Pacificispira spongiicola TaxID=2729598 RepID=A0A7Y0E3A1_9PROT|nr:DUF1153 domain-containing protein [Pacificispira spongiicola]NMM46353.1 DUF1153 domain-containing protein [Pacificispira spongiicola]